MSMNMKGTFQIKSSALHSFLQKCGITADSEILSDTTSYTLSSGETVSPSVYYEIMESHPFMNGVPRLGEESIAQWFCQYVTLNLGEEEAYGDWLNDEDTCRRLEALRSALRKEAQLPGDDAIEDATLAYYFAEDGEMDCCQVTVSNGRKVSRYICGYVDDSDLWAAYRRKNGSLFTIAEQEGLADVETAAWQNGKWCAL